MPGPVPNRAPRYGGFRSAQIRAAQERAYYHATFGDPSKYVSKSKRAVKDQNVEADDYAGYAEEQMEKKMTLDQVRRTPYNPAKGQYDRVKDYQ
jgi:hypothetical protein